MTFNQKIPVILSFLLGVFCAQVYAEPAKLEGGMPLVAARRALNSDGWKLPDYNAKCFCCTGDKLPSAIAMDECRFWSEGFLKQFSEFDGQATASDTVWGVYRNQHGSCMFVTYSYDRKHVKDTNPKKLLSGLRVVTWRLEPQCNE
jgi:hypothetical protein